MTNRIYLALNYKDAQIIKHALQEYVKRSDVKNKTDIENEKWNRTGENECIDISDFMNQ